MLLVQKNTVYPNSSKCAFRACLVLGVLGTDLIRSFFTMGTKLHLANACTRDRHLPSCHDSTDCDCLITERMQCLFPDSVM